MPAFAIRVVAAFWVVALIGFWPTYFSRLPEVPLHGHVHGLLVFGWFTLLLVQPWLIRGNRRGLHHALGWLSLAWVSAIVVFTLLAARHLLGRYDNPPTLYHLSIFSMIVPILVSFVVLYLQAIRHRRNMALHARYMLATGIVYLLPAWSRLIGIYVLPALGAYDDPPSVSQLLMGDQVGLVIMQLFTLVLLLRDRRRGQPWSPWAVCLVLLLLTHACLYLLPGLGSFASLARAIMITP